MKRRSPQAFTLIELLVVVAIIALLIAILLPALGKAREIARKSVCAANMKAQGMSALIYAAQFSDAFPAYTTTTGNTPNWLWDEVPEWGSALLNTAVANTNMSPTSVRKQFYCPSNTKQNDDTLWNYFYSGGVLSSNPVNPQLRVLGYAWLNDRSKVGGKEATDAAMAGLSSPGGNKRFPPFMNKIKSSQTGVGNGSMAELAFDAIISAGNTTNIASDNFTNVSGSFQGHTTSHLNGSSPAGANTLCMDGHVEWRKFSVNGAIPVGTTTAGTATPYFWFPLP